VDIAAKTVATVAVVGATEAETVKTAAMVVVTVEASAGITAAEGTGVMAEETADTTVAVAEVTVDMAVVAAGMAETVEMPMTITKVLAHRVVVVVSERVQKASHCSPVKLI